MRSESVAVKQARSILQGEHPLTGVDALIKELKKEKAFGLARRLIARAREMPEYKQDYSKQKKMAQAHALCTYKDPDLPVEFRLDRALEILKEVENLETSTDQETLGLTGAIFKRKWEWESLKLNLERSLHYYKRGYAQGIEKDWGYTAINTAFVLDALSYLEFEEARQAGTKSEVSELRREAAKKIREEIRTKLPGLLGEKEKNAYWYLVTMAEATLGLHKYEEETSYLKTASEIAEIADWEKESTVRQLIQLMTFHEKMGDFDRAKAKAALEALVPDEQALDSLLAGKVGLALSGGGFRASLFHIGVLARLAELDRLKNVDVLSCVSGGSIVGAHYYLALRELLQSEATITQNDYIQIVESLVKDFLAGVQRNIRTRVVLNPFKNFRMFLTHYSRSQRVAELFESEIYAKVKRTNDGNNNDKGIRLNLLQTFPFGENKDFSPKLHNWRIHRKVPILILNAASLNTGHNWQFTSSFMGEPPSAIDEEIDSNYRLRRMHYHQAPLRHQKLRLGEAVGASACVPGIFSPLALEALYDDKTVQLVDGGVQDNQGITGLLEQDCTFLIVSDASGQMETVDHPSSSALNVLLRSNSILMAKVREGQARSLAVRSRSRLLRGLIFLHLKKELDVRPTDWIKCQDPYREEDDPRGKIKRDKLASYGILKDVQRALARIRTDLDSFSDIEAYALMTSGYRMARTEFTRLFPQDDLVEKKVNWKFLQLQDPMKDHSHPAYDLMMSVLKAGEKKAFKAWSLSPVLKWATYALFALVVFWGVGWIMENWNLSFIPVEKLKNIRVQSIVKPIGIAVGLFVAGIVAETLFGKTGRKILEWIQVKDMIKRILYSAITGFVGWLVAGLHLLIFDKWYLTLGRVSRLPDLSQERTE